MGMAAILFSGVEPFEQIVSIFLRQKAPSEVWRNLVKWYQICGSFCLPEKRSKEIEKIAEEMKERDR